MKRNYEQGKEYIWRESEKSLGGYSRLIGEIILDDPNRDILGFVYGEGDEADGFFVDLKDIYKYRDFITTFTIGMEEEEPTIFWIHLV